MRSLRREARYAALGEVLEQRRRSHGRPLHRGGLAMQAGHGAVGLEVQLVEQEVVRVLHLQAHVTEGLRREVAEVGGHDHVRAATRGSGHYVAVVGIREDDAGLQRLPARDHCVVEGG
ncbi:MAG TPA: hypothetical protein VIJ07_22845, partial [Dermatophilaceae bacterium]